MHDRELLKSQQLQRIEALAHQGGLRAVVDDFMMAEAMDITPVVGGQETLHCLIRSGQAYPMTEEDIYYLDNILYIRQPRILWIIVSSHVLDQMLKAPVSCKPWLDILMAKEEFHLGFERWARSVRQSDFTPQLIETNLPDKEWARVWNFIWNTGITSEHSLGAGMCWLKSGQPEMSYGQAAGMWKAARGGSLPQEVAAMISKSALAAFVQSGHKDEQDQAPLI